ncbi:glycosyltransferase family 1 protein [Wenzhouxiangella sp. XN79A]|uniref:glycosyltransferase family 4 protein n=1 Tax=Wenzhouxiangella sp. XN79A TaxID=2724193 RepID=UPI00144AC6FB|nr:glycosyltransferase family 1 protein [Wenzhouxiangella sp. XN79A]NKI35983.1 glycosyltransferase family 1 protein [Wenzhouxiangella sp. XN79A]
MKLLLVSDAWAPQVNGVARTLSQTRETLIELGHDVVVLSPEGQRTLPCPGYPEIRLTIGARRAARRCLDRDGPFDAIHIATEGPLGWAARRECLKRGLEFTTSCHTRFPEYLRMRAPVPLAWSYALLRRFHGAARRTLVRSESHARVLRERGFEHLAVWPGAVDTALFRPRGKDALDLPRPIAMYMGRVAPEKNIEAFLELDLPGSRVVVGGGPALDTLQRRFPDVHFLGYRHGEALAETLSAADVFVFPSRTDTFGLVILEAQACGVPVAAYPVPGPLDLVTDGANGALDDDLAEAVFRALAVAPEDCIENAAGYSWRQGTLCFVELLAAACPPRAERVDPARDATALADPAQ